MSEAKKRLDWIAGRIREGFSTPHGLALTAVKSELATAPAQFAVINVRNQPIWHRRTYAAAGQTSLTFFNEGQADFVTNLPSQGVFPSNTMFALRGISVDLVPNVNRDGTVGSDPMASDSTGTMLDSAEKIRQILKTGRLQMQIGQFKVLDVPDLTHFPMVGGLFGSVAAATTNTSVDVGAAILNNGAGHQVPAPIGPAAILVPGGQSINLEISWQNAITMTSAATMAVYLHGTLFGKR